MPGDRRHRARLAAAGALLAWSPAARAQSPAPARDTAGSAALAPAAARTITCAAGRPLRGALPLAGSPLQCVPQLEVFGDGNVKDVLGGGGAAGAASASGALGLHFAGPVYDVTGLVNIAGTNDTVRSHFGATVLVPAAGRALNAASLMIRGRFREWGDRQCAEYTYPKICNLGYRVHADASTRTWATQTIQYVTTVVGAPVGSPGDTTTRITGTREVPTWGGGVDLSYTFFQGAVQTAQGADLGGQPVYMVLDVGYAHRSLRGDLTSPALAGLRDALLGTHRQKNYDGLEVGLTMQFNQVRSSFTYVLLNGGVNGLSRGQIVGAVDLRAVLASGLLRR